jgi:adenine phosphoribosyltransferase
MVTSITFCSRFRRWLRVPPRLRCTTDRITHLFGSVPSIFATLLRSDMASAVPMVSGMMVSETMELLVSDGDAVRTDATIAQPVIKDPVIPMGDAVWTNPWFTPLVPGLIPSEVQFNRLFPIVQDFPQKGIQFRDITPFLASPVQFDVYKAWGAALHKAFPQGIDVFDYAEARGFLFTVLSLCLPAPHPLCAPARKPGKLPGETVCQQYGYEYGKDEVHNPVHSITPGQKVVFVDDVLATGGTCEASLCNIRKLGGTVLGVTFLIEIEGLGGRQRLEAQGIQVISMFRVPLVSPNAAFEIQPALKALPSSVVPPCTRDLPHPIVIFACPSMQSKAQQMVSLLPDLVRLGHITWGTFPDGTLNCKFEHQNQLQSSQKHLIFMGDTRHSATFSDQIKVMTALSEQPSLSFTIDLPFLSNATHERIVDGGAYFDEQHRIQFTTQALATAKPFLTQVAGAVSGRPSLRVVDMHALGEAFYTSSQDLQFVVQLSLMPQLLRQILFQQFGMDLRKGTPGKGLKSCYCSKSSVCPSCSSASSLGKRAPLVWPVVLAFLDDGAIKRFRPFFENVPYIVCNKKRGEGDERSIVVSECHLVDPEDIIEVMMLVDDLVQSGNTLLVGQEALRREFTCVQEFQCFVTHPVFPQGSFKKFLTYPKNKVPRADEIAKGGARHAPVFSTFYVGDTIPDTVSKLRGLPPFQIIDSNPVMLHAFLETHGFGKGKDSRTDAFYYPKGLVVEIASTNDDKCVAVQRAIHSHFTEVDEIVWLTSNAPSGVNNQPVGLQETLLGARNRLSGRPPMPMLRVSMESGLFSKPGTNDEWYCQTCVIVQKCFGDKEDARGAWNKEVVVWSLPYSIDADCVQAAGASGWYTTSGSLMALKYACKNASNWHQSVHGIQRADIMSEAIRLALYQLS